MPYKDVNEAEKKNPALEKYSAKAKRGWVGSFNQCMTDGGPEDKCFAIAYSVANKVDGRQPSTKKSSEASELLKIAKDLLAADTFMKKGQWFLYDKHGFGTDYREWKRGPKFVQVIGVKPDRENSVFNQYALQSYNKYGEKMEKVTISQRQLSDFRDESKLNQKYEPISRPRWEEKPEVMDEREVRALAKKYLKWFDEEEDLMWVTRDNGDVGSEEPGEEDIKAAREFARAVKSKVSGAAVSIEAVDEWVHVSVTQAK